jgi:hypothetical protein
MAQLQGRGYRAAAHSETVTGGPPAVSGIVLVTEVWLPAITDPLALVRS